MTANTHKTFISNWSNYFDFIEDAAELTCGSFELEGNDDSLIPHRDILATNGDFREYLIFKPEDETMFPKTLDAFAELICPDMEIYSLDEFVELQPHEALGITEAEMEDLATMYRNANLSKNDFHYFMEKFTNQKIPHRFYKRAKMAVLYAKNNKSEE